MLMLFVDCCSSGAGKQRPLFFQMAITSLQSSQGRIVPSETKMILCLTKLILVFTYYTESRASEVPERNNPFLFQKQSYLSPHKEPAVYLEKFGKCVWFNGSGVDQCLSLRHLIFFNILLTPSLPKYLQFHSKTYYLKKSTMESPFSLCRIPVITE